MKDTSEIKHIRQYRDDDCGIAIISILAQKKYSTVKKALIESQIVQKNNCYINFIKLIKGLLIFNIKVRKRNKFKRWRDIPAP